MEVKKEDLEGVQESIYNILNKEVLDLKESFLEFKYLLSKIDLASKLYFNLQSLKEMAHNERVNG